MFEAVQPIYPTDKPYRASETCKQTIILVATEDLKNVLEKMKNYKGETMSAK